ncbi:alcohol dehydrogenase catalytic domain-containing protein [Companilactobacillus metriopterae]|uniref:alcohol dehydrogenase catalytic domain-containing protein n=1 Tax=Companilactobacillus metriopterae TaxID=1909267 RepID=UPI00100A9F8A|nr:zinc-binding dehydrogenase [Companilactobacillus metriopterae]
MKAVKVFEAGGPEVLKITEVPIPKVKPGWSLVKIKGFGINHSEIFTRDGLSPSVKFPRILGIECVGIIEESTSDKFSKGEKIISIMGEMGRAFDGSYAEYVLLPNEQIYPVKTELSWEDLAAIPETYYTAFESLKALQVKDDDTILVRSGASGVGVAFLRLIKAKNKSQRVVASVRSLSKRDKLIELGYDDVVEDKDSVLQTTEIFDKSLELVGPTTLKDTFEHIKNGIVCDTGLLGGKWDLEGFEPVGDIPNGSYLTAIHSGDVDYNRILEMIDYIEDNSVEVKPAKIYSLDEIADAHRYLESSNGFGKVIVMNKN